MKRSRRNKRVVGASLVELLVVTMLMGFVMAAVLQMIAAMSVTSNRLTNKAGAISALNWYGSYLGADIRQATSITVNPTGRDLQLTVPVFTNEFPSAFKTVIYSIQPHPSIPDEYQMVRTVGGVSQVILKGVIGPKDTSGQVEIFKYKQNPHGFPGALVDIDLKTPDSSASNAQGIGIHNEWYLRSAKYSNL